MLARLWLPTVCLYTLWTVCSAIWIMDPTDPPRVHGDHQGVATWRGDIPETPDPEEPDPFFIVDLGLGDSEEETEEEALLELKEKLEEEEEEKREELSQLFDWEHWVQRQNSRYDHGLGLHVKFSPNFHFNWDMSFGLSGGNWWEGPNVCQREEESEEFREPRSRGIVHHHVTSTSRCDDTWSAYKCTTQISTHNITKKYSVIYECCHGYQRETGRQGCTQELPVRTLLETLDDLKAADMREAMEGISISGLLETQNYTVFSPSDGLLEHFKPIKDGSSNVVVVSPDVVQMARTLEETVLSHVVQGVVKTTHMEDELLLPTLSSGHSIRINMYEAPSKLLTANCRPITSSDNMADNGVVHVIDGILPPVRDTIADIVTSNPDLSMLKTLIGHSGLLSMLRRSGQYTLLAPSNTAFSRLNPYVRQKLLDGDMCMAEVVRNHVLPNVVCSGALDADLMTINLLNDYLNVDRRQGKLFVAGAQLLETDLMATNGVVHVIDDVLIPSGALTMPDVLRQVNASEMLELMGRAGLMQEFTELSDYTFLVPSDQAIEAMDPATLSTLKDDPARLREVLFYHVLNSTEQLDDLRHGALYSTLRENEMIHVGVHESVYSLMGMRRRPNDKIATFQCARVVQHDVGTCGGVIHLIDRVLEPPTQTLVERILTDPRFRVFAELLNQTNIPEQLTEYSELTAFIPTNQAIDSLTIDEKDFILDSANIENFLKQHFVEGRVCCARMGRSRMVFDTTLAGGLLLVSRRGRQLYVNNSPVGACDQMARDGVVHALDRVHLPPYMPFQRAMRGMMSRAHDVSDRLDRYIDRLYDRVFNPPRSAVQSEAPQGTLTPGVSGTPMMRGLARKAEPRKARRLAHQHGHHGHGLGGPQHGANRDRAYHRRGHRDRRVKWTNDPHGLNRRTGQTHLGNKNRKQTHHRRGRGHV